MSTFRVTPEGLEATGAHFASALAEFDSRVTAANAAVAGLVGSGWSGRAADGFGRGWAEVIDGVGEVQEALAGMARLLPEAAALYATTDETVAADSTRDADAGAGTGAS